MHASCMFGVNSTCIHNMQNYHIAVENYGGIGSLQQIIYQFTLTDLLLQISKSTNTFLSKFRSAKVSCCHQSFVLCKQECHINWPIIHVACFIKHAWKLQCNIHSIMSRPGTHVWLKTFNMDYHSDKTYTYTSWLFNSV